MSDQETLQGALNRVQRAQEARPDADLWVGIEGGCCHQYDRTWVFAWVVVQSQTQREQAKTSSFCLPLPIVELLMQGMELGTATDVFFGKQNSKHDGGIVGALSHGLIDRTAYYVQPMILALMAFDPNDL